MSPSGQKRRNLISAKRKSILILSATAGAGHVRAGDALVSAAAAYRLPAAVRHEDILKYTAPVFRRMYADIYTAIVQKSPEMWDYLYEHTLGPRRKKSPFLKLFDHFNYRQYLRALETMRPDAVICTHFLPYVAITDEIRKTGWKIPFFTVPTDYKIHPLWIDPSVMRYYVASEEAGWTLRYHGIGPDRILVTGIPVMPGFVNPPARSAAARKLGIKPGVFTVMVLSGGYGIGVIDRLVPELLRFLGDQDGRKFQMLVVCGRNTGLYEQLTSLGPHNNVDLRCYKFIPFIEQLMSASDILITKSGALSTTEAATCRIPMILFGSTPGQESHNALYFTEHGAALRATSTDSLFFRIHRILRQPAIAERMKRNADPIRRPAAAHDILLDVVKTIS